MKSEHDPSSGLKKLQYWLNLELPGTILLILSFFYNVAFYVFLVAALFFTPFLFKVLYQEKRFGWLLLFVLFVLLPSVILFFSIGSAPALNSQIFTPGHLLAGSQMVTSGIFIGLYVFYCFILKASIPGMLDAKAPFEESG